MKTKNAEILLASVIVARATSYVMNKYALADMEAMNVLAVRFILAFVIISLIFAKRLLHIDGKSLKAGILIGIAFSVVMAVEMLALKYTDSSKVAFLENTAVVFVPLINGIIVKKLPSAKILGCAVITLGGIGFLTLGEGFTSVGTGEILGILSGITYAIAIISTAHYSRESDGLLAGIVQLGTMGILTLITSFIFETPHLPIESTVWMIIMYLAVVCSCFGFTLQPVAQKYVSTEKAGLMCALSPLAAAVMGLVFLDEKLGFSGIIGGVAIMSGIVLQTVFESKIFKEKNSL